MEMSEVVHRFDVAARAQADRDGLLSDAVRERGTVLMAPASEADIADLEGRLGVSLPPSYRQFLRQSDGAWAMSDVGALDPDQPWSPQPGLLPTSDVGWLRDRETEMARAYEEDPLELDGLPDEVYFDYSLEQDPVWFRREHLPGTLAISSYEDREMVLLNPAVQFDNGEWEVWHYSDQFPGVIRYPSFHAYLTAIVEVLERPGHGPDGTAPHPPDGVVP
jgi:hypothetical protein